MKTMMIALCLTLMFASVVHGQNTTGSFNRITGQYVVILVRPVSNITEGSARIQVTLTPLPRPRFSSIDEIFPFLHLLLPLPSASQKKNICFVIDISGSMQLPISSRGTQTRVDWVKEVFNLLIKEFGPDDFISAVIFDDTNEIIIEPQNVTSEDDRQNFIGKINGLMPRGKTMIAQGLATGYANVKAVKDQLHDPDYINRVLLLTDGEGQDPKKGVFDLVENYKSENISTISLSAGADKKFMDDIANRGGGLSIFIEQYEPADIFRDKLMLLMTSSRTEIETEVGKAWQRMTWDIALNMHLERGVKFESVDAIDGILPNIQDTIKITLQEGASKSISLMVNLQEEAIQKGDIMTITISCQDGRKQFPTFTPNRERISLTNPPPPKGSNSFFTFNIPGTLFKSKGGK
jgi:hypothetical protein